MSAPAPATTVDDSRVWNGSLTFTPTGTGATAVAFSCQVTNVRIDSTVDTDGDPQDMLCGTTLPAPKTLTDSLAGTIIQDFDNESGFYMFCRQHKFEIVGFEFVPNDQGGPDITGQCEIVPMDTMGGDVNTRNTSDFEFEIIGEPVFTYASQGSATPPAGGSGSTDTGTGSGTDTGTGTGDTGTDTGSGTGTDTGTGTGSGTTA